MLLDENFPAPPGFDPTALDGRIQFTGLRGFDGTLVGRRTPDWYLYLRADEAQFDALVTRDWHQSAQAEEMWALTRTRLSVVTWSDPINDPVAEWGQLLAYMTEILKMIDSHDSCVVLLPHPRLNKRNTLRASDALDARSTDSVRNFDSVGSSSTSLSRSWIRGNAVCSFIRTAFNAFSAACCDATQTHRYTGDSDRSVLSA
jgi:hypothetical protein